MFKSQLIHAGLSLTNYLQNAFLEDPKHAVTNQPESDHKEEALENRPPKFLRPIFEAGRPYFKLNYADALNNIRCLVLPVGKVKQVIPDLYIPSVSASTFMIASSVIMCIKSKGKLRFPDALSKTLTRFFIVNLAEIVLLTGLLYYLSISHAPEVAAAGTQTYAPQPYQPGPVDPYAPFGGQPGLRQPPGYYPNAPYPQGYPAPQHPVQAGVPTTSLRDKTRLKLPEVLVVIGYKYFLLNYLLLVTAVLPFRVVTALSMVYVGVSALIFSIRSIKSLRSLHSNSSHPLIFLFPVLQPVFLYFVLPPRKI